MINFFYDLFHLNKIMNRVLFFSVFSLLVISSAYLFIYLFTDEIILMYFVVTPFILIIGTLFIMYTFRRFLSPILQLSKALHKAKNEKNIPKLNPNLYKHSPEEIQQVISALNETISHFQQRENQLEKLAYTDSLTKLANRRAFDNKFKQIWVESIANQQYLSIALIDIDRFKEFNDTFGHLAGDQCLRDIANEMAYISKGNLVARYGGEEFIIVFPGINHQEATAKAEHVRKQVENLQIQRSKVNNDARYVTVSIGVATTVPKKDKDLNSLIELADQALYEAKRRGRNNIVKKSETHLFVI